MTLHPSGRSFDVPPELSILEAGLQAGIALPYSCRSGVCSTCRGRIVEGKVDFGKVHPNYLGEADRAAGYALLCQARPLEDIALEVREVDPALATRPRKRLARVTEIRKVAPDVALLKLRLHMNDPMSFRPGQYIEFLLDDGRRRAYSIATAPMAGGNIDLELHVRHVPGGAWTDHVFTSMEPRQMVRIEAPLGVVRVDDEAERTILIAGGTGFSPIKAVVEDAIQRGARRRMALYWGARQRNGLYLAELAARWAQEHEWLSFVPVLSDPTADDAWEGRKGLVHEAVLQDFANLSDCEVYACGSPAMVEAARRDLVAKGRLAPHRFLADVFLTQADKMSGGAGRASLSSRESVA